MITLIYELKDTSKVKKLLTGAGFGVEASCVAILGYLLVCTVTLSRVMQY